MHIVLFEPEIPPNTGNIARLCAATKTELHLIEPLGFSLDEKHLKRAGLDYWPYVQVHVWPTFMAYTECAGSDKRLIATSSKQGQNIHSFAFGTYDALIFGPETRGLPQNILEQTEASVRIPLWGQVRSLNLSTAAGIVLYYALDKSGILDTIP